MLKKISVLITAIFISILAVSCNSGSGSSSSVTINFNGAKALSSVDGLSAIQKVPTNLPEGVDSIEVIVTGSAAEGELYRNSFDVDEIGDTVSFEVASGAARNFRVIGRDISLQPRYQGLAESVDLPEGGEINVTITMGAYVADSVDFTVKLVDTDGQNYALPDYAIAGSNAINAALYKPVVIEATAETEQTIDLNQANPVDIETSSTSTDLSMTGLSETYQLLMVRTTSIDGTIAAMGSAVINDLKKGETRRTVTVIMIPPARIKIINSNSSTINNENSMIKMRFLVGGTTWSAPYIVADEKYKVIGTEILADNEAIYLVPNRLDDIGKIPGTNESRTPISREVEITINGVIVETKTFTTSGDDKDMLRWKTTVLDLTKTDIGRWTVPDAK